MIDLCQLLQLAIYVFPARYWPLLWVVRKERSRAPAGFENGLVGLDVSDSAGCDLETDLTSTLEQAILASIMIAYNFTESDLL